MSEQKKERSGHITASVIGCLGGVVAAIISGIFLVISVTMPRPSDNPTSANSNPVQANSIAPQESNSSQNSSSSNSSNAVSDLPRTGGYARDFNLSNSFGSNINLSNELRRHSVVLVFYYRYD